MNHMTANTVKKDFTTIPDYVIKQGDTIPIATNDGAAILVNQGEWNGLQETLLLQSVPGMKDSIWRAGPLLLVNALIV